MVAILQVCVHSQSGATHIRPPQTDPSQKNIFRKYFEKSKSFANSLVPWGRLKRSKEKVKHNINRRIYGTDDTFDQDFDNISNTTSTLLRVLDLNFRPKDDALYS